ncbi:MAG: hypothetical protein DPW09_37220 [Anaerolineae bacterium]|nr:hypothetical protein [Anaerolineae bacterium]GIK38964.1 MAG: hypothetical protein BroJett011_27970 [Chloroflexota bacterium]
MDRLDQYVEKVLIPTHTKGLERRENPAYTNLASKIANHQRRGRKEQARQLRKQLQQLPSKDPADPDFRRLRYVRYADDALLGFTGPQYEAKEIKRMIGEFLRDNLKLKLSEEKTLITHATSQAAVFLGYEIVNQQANDKHDQTGRRCANGRIGLRVPKEVVDKAKARYMKHGYATHRKELLDSSDYSIVRCYQQEYQGIVQYFALAQNVCWFYDLHWVMETSLLKTLAHKHQITLTKIARKYITTRSTPEGQSLRCLEVQVERKNKPPLIAQFGGLALKRQPFAILNDQPPVYRSKRTEILKRMLANECELCGSGTNIEVHHIRHLKNLTKRGRREKPEWVKRMAALRRKTLVVCFECHTNIHKGRLIQRRQDNSE